MNIDDSTREKINKIAILLGLDLVVLHGSKATGVSISQESDVDIAVYRKAEKLSFKEEIDLISKFQQLFDEEVDVKQLNNKPLFFYEVMKDAKLLYGNQTIFDEMYLHAYKQFIDSKSLFELTKVMQNNRQKLLSQKHVK